jgi:fatty-acyl-CoA synthase
VGGYTANKTWLSALEAAAPIGAHPLCLLPDVIREMAEKRGDAPALLSASECFTYRALAERVNQFARWALAQSDTVCLIMPNRREYMAIWLGLTSVGVVVSLINTQLDGCSLAHCTDVVAPKR